MQIGVTFPQTELAGRGPDDVRHFAQAAEALGYRHIVAYDHILGAVRSKDEAARPAGPYTIDDPFHEPFVLFSYLAACTKDIGFVTAILVLPQRQTALAAKQAADLALLSGGRLRVGVGVGWNEPEFEALGMDFRSRGRRLDEQIVLLRELWSAPAVDFVGLFDVVHGCGIVPSPGPIPIWVGGHSEPGFRRAARLAEGFIFGGADGAKTLADHRRLRELVHTLRPDPSTFGYERAIRDYVDPIEAADAVYSWGAHGGTHVSVRTLDLGFQGVEEHIEYLARVADALGDDLKPRP